MYTHLFAVLLTVLPVVFIVFGLFFILRRSNNYDKTVVDFITRRLASTTSREYFEQEQLSNFRDLVKNGQSIAAAKEYQTVMTASIAESSLAVKIAKAFK